MCLFQGGMAAGAINANYIFNISTPTNKPHGFAGLGTTSWGIADFDNVHLAKPYAGKGDGYQGNKESSSFTDQTLRFERIGESFVKSQEAKLLKKFRKIGFSKLWSKSLDFMSVLQNHRK